jgi:chaperonin GroEL
VFNGGVALLYASQDLDKLPTTKINKKVGVQIIQNALKVPLFFTYGTMLVGL